MAQLSKYQLIKMYLSINGYDSIKELANDWGFHVNSIRDYCRGKFYSAELEELTDQFIETGDKKLQEHRERNLTNSN